MKRYLTWGLLPMCVFGLLAAFFWRGLSLNPAELPSARLDQKLPAFEVPVLGDKSRFFSADNIKGHPAILHVFASWCDVCTEEQVFLLTLADKGVPLYGLNYKDDPFDAMGWLQTWGNPYRLIGQDREGHAGMELGVYGTPETFLIDSNGFIRYRYVGIINAHIWDEILQPKWDALV
ncbi:MAG: DsbE family thiol:disulfide interchange protein [Gammaproteobacteria bacterium]|nr:DsbE family thiol:disulfide interchange protein [Gammaproteobacteria bacterium]MCH9716320.1 DsbE family thiol:disulfide interchange protein [Gammaproteobacteria bacterium]MCH9763522.1 DsbE family thiol:disulfide interchange protein [Gammaproteobacteria bacterium]